MSGNELPNGTSAPARCDIAIVGGGILGLALARELTRRHAQLSVCVLEREVELASHQTNHSSGVIHAGLYYTPGSLKARLCVQGARELLEYCAENGIEHDVCGKLIVAVRRSELSHLAELQRIAQANGVAGLRRLHARDIEAIEPHARGIAALHSPSTAIVDFRSIARRFARDALEAGASVVTGCPVEHIQPTGRALRLCHPGGETQARNALFCAGAWSDRLAVAAGADSDPRIVPFRGAYLRLRSERRDLVRGLIYPVPDPALPFLGVHLTRHISGEVLIGPTALVAGARDAVKLIRAEDLLDTLSWPGSWRMFARWWRTGLGELHKAIRRTALVHTAAQYVPELQLGDVERAFAGVRAQALGRKGQLIDDFVFSATERALHIRNAPSPGATSSLAIARYLADLADRTFGLAR